MKQFKDFATRRITTANGEVHVKIGGEGQPLLLLHGFPQTHLMWGPVVSLLRENFTLVVPDLPGYGASTPPPDVERSSKRVIAKSMSEVMKLLGFERFAIAGHDRGARVAYRLALDNPDLITRLAVLDILPTYDYWMRMDRSFAIKIYHWAFLAQPEPLPETLISGAPDYYIDAKLSSWSKSKDLSAFAPIAMEAYRDNARDPRRLKAMCDDYRAGATIDMEDDTADFENGRKITAPTLALWGEDGVAQSAETSLDVWKRWCFRVEGKALDCGHFLPEENPTETAVALSDFFKSTT